MMGLGLLGMGAVATRATPRLYREKRVFAIDRVEEPDQKIAGSKSRG
jgi:hypothetical protein